MKRMMSGLLLCLASFGTSASVIVNQEFEDVKYAMIDGQSLSSFSQVSFNNVSHNCSRNRFSNNEGFSIHHGSVSCYTNMADLDTGVSTVFNLTSDSIFDISFSADRISYGTSYSSRVMWNGLFYLNQRRGSSDSITLMDGTVLSASSTTNTNYRLSYNDEGFRFYQDQTLVHENLGYVIAAPIDTYMQVRLNNARYYLNGLNVAIYRERTQVEIDEYLASLSGVGGSQGAVDVPEPSSLVMMGLGGVFLMLRRKLVA